MKTIQAFVLPTPRRIMPIIFTGSCFVDLMIPELGEKSTRGELVEIPAGATHICLLLPGAVPKDASVGVLQPEAAAFPETTDPERVDETAPRVTVEPAEGEVGGVAMPMEQAEKEDEVEEKNKVDNEGE